MPKVTIIMPAFNVASYVAEAIESIRRQTFADYILLVIDDGSTDATPQIVASIHDERIVYERNAEHAGLANTLNRGLQMVKTEYVARFDADDIAMPRWLERSIDFLDHHTDYGICSSGFEWFGSRSGRVRYPRNHEDSLCSMLFGCTVIVPVIRRSLITENNLRYRPETFPAEDYDLWATCYRITKVYNIQHTMFRYRMHSTQVSTSKSIQQATKSNMVRLRMLEWLNPDITDADRNYFLHHFVPGTIENPADVDSLCAFAQRLLSYNSYGHYKQMALAKCLKRHVHNAVYVNAINQYMHRAGHYSLAAFYHIASSHTLRYFTPLQTARVFLKCLIHRKA